MKPKKWIIAGVVVLLLVYVCMKFPLWRYWYVGSVYEHTYGETAKELIYIGTWYDRQQVRSVLDLAEEAFSAVEISEEEAEEKFGMLSRYAINTPYKNAERVEYSLKLLSAHCDKNSGVMWVKYSQYAYDEQGESVGGSKGVESRWTIEKNEQGDWIVTDILEAP